MRGDRLISREVRVPLQLPARARIPAFPIFGHPPRQAVLRQNRREEKTSIFLAISRQHKRNMKEKVRFNVNEFKHRFLGNDDGFRWGLPLNPSLESH